MDYRRHARDFLCLLVAFTLTWTGSSTAAINAVSACHGTQIVECDFFNMTCAQGTRIRVLDMKYGFKEYPCRRSKSRCFEQKTNRLGCCVYNEDDCQGEYVPLHAYDLYKYCSMEQTCKLQAPNNILSACKQPSTYVYLTYECVPFTEELSIDFCEKGTINPGEKKASIVFRKSTNKFTGSTCSCRIVPLLSNITATFVDIRMFQQQSGSASKCSSAQLKSDPVSDISTECSSKKEEEDNFIYNTPFLIGGKQLKLTLTDLNKNEVKEDVPEVVWLTIEGALRIDCSPSELPEVTTLPVTPSLTTGNANSTGTDDASGGGNTAVIAGVVAGVLIVALAVGICVFVYFKRRIKAPKRKMARQNSYTKASSVRSTSSDIYDEINDVEPTKIYDPVYEPRKTEPLYDPVYEPKLNKGAAAPTPNSLASKTHTYQNVGKVVHRTSEDSSSSVVSESKGRFVIPKRLKAPFSRVKKQKDRLVDFIKTRRGQDQGNTKQRPREESAGSYDHLRINGTTLHASTSDPEPAHAYAHTAGNQKVTDTHGNKKAAGAQASKQQNSPKGIKDQLDNVPNDSDLQAVDVGDQYIEFTFDADESSPNLVKMKEPDMTSHHLRPTPPARDPPSLNSSRSPSPLPKPVRSPSPFTVAQSITTDLPQDSLAKAELDPFYDYADPNRLSPNVGRRSPRVFASSDTDTRETDTFDDPPEYDYAHVSDGAEDARSERADSVYEDVERKLREASMKKHRSDTDMDYSLSGYEVPVTSQARPVSSPNTGASTQGVSEINTSNIRTMFETPISTKEGVSENKKLNNNKRIPFKAPNVTKASEKVVPDLTSELQLKLLKNKEKHIKPSNVKDAKGTVNCAKTGVVKSDNISTKDYEKAPDKKSVLNMAKVFEQK